MAIYRCKICGGTLEIGAESVVTCEYCGTQQTLPSTSSEHIATLYERADHFRRSNDFDKAIGIYEQILNEDNTDAEAYWSLVLCRYGIEYVEDPKSSKRIATVNRMQYTSVLADEDYRSAIKYASIAQRSIYEAEAKEIDGIQKGILAISQKEEPFDVFICYKETDANGRRTPDSVLANDLYHQLTNEGFKVFYSRITLEDKLGTAYEPYIFAALNSAKVMVVIGTKPEYFNAVWVKNEWSRFLALTKNGANKILIPAYRDMDPYDLPEEFSHLQAQDMSKLGFMQDLIRGIEKLTKGTKKKAAEAQPSSSAGGSTAPLLRRVFIFLEDGDWQSANEYCEKVLDLDPENAEAYLGKLMVELHVKSQDALKDQARPFDSNSNFQKALRFADEKLKTQLSEAIDFINTRNENDRLNAIYDRAILAQNSAVNYQDYDSAAEIFETIPNWRDSKQRADSCREMSVDIKNDIYAKAVKAFETKTDDSLATAMGLFARIQFWKDAKKLQDDCAQEYHKEMLYIQANRELASATTHVDYETAKSAFLEIGGWKDSEQLAIEAQEKADGIKDNIYFRARDMSDELNLEKLTEALSLLGRIPMWRDSEQLATFCQGQLNKVKRIEADYVSALALMKRGNLKELQDAKKILEANIEYKDCKQLLTTCEEKIVAVNVSLEEQRKVAALEAARNKKKKIIAAIVLVIIAVIIAIILVITNVVLPSVDYNKAVKLYKDARYEEALEIFVSLDGFKDSEKQIQKCEDALDEIDFNSAIDLMVSGKYNDARNVFVSLEGYKSSAGKIVLIDKITKINTANFEATIKSILKLNEQVTIRYNTEGGSYDDGEAKTCTNDADYASIKPQKEGYRFVQFQYNSFYYTKDKGLIINLDCVWTDSYLIDYELNGGAVENPTEYRKDGKAITLNNPTKYGYTFIGWTGTDIPSPTLSVTIPAGSHGNRTFTANWKVNEYTFTLNAGGGKVSQTKIVAEYNGNYSLPTPTRDYYTFAGWYDGSVKYTNNTWKKAGNVTLTAKWTPNSYSITYNLNGGTNSSQNPKSYTVETAKITLKSASRTGYKFIGWYSDSALTSKVTEIAKGSHSNITLYAKWELVTYTISYNLNGGSMSGIQNTTFTINTLPVALSAPTRDYYTFDGWYIGSVKYNNNTWEKPENVTLKAKWTPLSYSITYNLNGGTNSSQNPNSYTVETPKITLKDPSRRGYKFIGWYSDSALTSRVSEIAQGSHAKITLYAKWEIVTYTITYNLNGGSMSGAPKTTFTVNDLPVSLPTPTKSGLSFTNWSVNTLDGEYISEITDIGNVTVVASYMDPNLKLTASTDGSYYIVTKYASSGSASILDIPAYYKGKPVKEISHGAFLNCKTLVTINIPDTVQNVGSSVYSGAVDGVFEGCSNLKNVNLPNGITYISKYAFNHCESLTSITIPATVQNIGAYAFAYSGLTSIVLPNSVIEVDSYAFSFCQKLSSVKLSTNLKTISDSMFFGCKSLKTISVPNKVETIERSAFLYCDMLENVTLSEGLKEIESSAFSHCKSLKKIIIPNSVEKIEVAIDGAGPFVFSDLTIYCRTQVIPDGWGENWNNNNPVVWDYTGS